MKTSKILLLISAVLLLASCSNDDDNFNVLDTTKVNVVTEEESFVDPDGRVYKCVRIGNQIWMAENLAYYLEGGQLAGCYTWNESDVDETEIDEELANMEKLTPGKFADIVEKVYKMKSRNEWIALGEGAIYDAYYSVWYYCGFGYWSIEEGLAYLEPYPVYFSLLQQTLAEYNKTKEQMLREHHDNAETANGNYSEENGLLYSLDGAKAAVAALGEGSGWRVPSDEDWKKLEATLGMSGDLDDMNAWRSNNAGDYLKVGGEAKFDAIYSGCNAWQYNRPASGLYINRNYSAYFWCSDETTRMETETPEEGETDEDGELKEETTYEVREGIVRQVSIYTPKIWRGVTRLDGVCYSVRLVKDAN